MSRRIYGWMSVHDHGKVVTPETLFAIGMPVEYCIPLLDARKGETVIGWRDPNHPQPISEETKKLFGKAGANWSMPLSNGVPVAQADSGRAG